MDKYICHGWACTDCMILLANGESPAEMSEEQCAEWQSQIDANTEGYRLTVGMLLEDHDDTCPRRAGDKDAECDCETLTFSWSACDVCGGNLGGERHAVSFWKPAD